MEGALRARQADAALQKRLALMTAYFGGKMAAADWEKAPSFADFVQRFEPRVPKSNAEIAARFAVMAMRASSDQEGD